MLEGHLIRYEMIIMHELCWDMIYSPTSNITLPQHCLDNTDSTV